jgi:hypothetical protein
MHVQNSCTAPSRQAVIFDPRREHHLMHFRTPSACERYVEGVAENIVSVFADAAIDITADDALSIIVRWLRRHPFLPATRTSVAAHEVGHVWVAYHNGKRHIDAEIHGPRGGGYNGWSGSTGLPTLLRPRTVSSDCGLANIRIALAGGVVEAWLSGGSVLGSPNDIARAWSTACYIGQRTGTEHLQIISDAVLFACRVIGPHRLILSELAEKLARTRTIESSTPRIRTLLDRGVTAANRVPPEPLHDAELLAIADTLIRGLYDFDSIASITLGSPETFVRPRSFPIVEK